MSRRTFIEMIGFSAAALALEGCRAPEQKIIPYLKQPVELTPGVANWYASTCGGCSAACGVLVKVRDGRPIKLEGNPEHPLSRGGLCPVAHGMIFELYDSDRLRQPLIAGKAATWDEADGQIAQKLAAIRQSGGGVRLLTKTIQSPTSLDTIAKFVSQFKDGKHVVYEAFSTGAISQSHLRTHGIAAIPSHRFDRAKLVVSFGADFLGSWLSPVEFTRAYTRARELRDGQRDIPQHVQFESRMSLTGGNAGRRIKVSAAEEIQSLLLLARLVAEKTRAAAPTALASFEPSLLSREIRLAVEGLAARVARLPGESLIVSGSNDVDVQSIVNFINQSVGGYGKTVDLNSTRTGSANSDAEMVDLVRDMNDGKIAALVTLGVNPAYDYHAAPAFIGAMAKVPLKISLNPYRDETGSLCDYSCPTHHFLEAWDDAQPARGVFSLNQPTISPLFQTRAYQESLLRWSGGQRSFYDVIRASWKEKLFPLQTSHKTFDEFWDHSLEDGVFAVDPPPVATVRFTADSLADSAARLELRSKSLSGGVVVTLYEKAAIHDGAHANNPWLHELPDPVTKITWDNYACVSPGLARKLRLEEGRVIQLTAGAATLELPVHVQPGQHDDCIAVAVGYGRTKAGKAGTGVGVNAFPLVSFYDGAFSYVTGGAAIERTSMRVEMASTQLHATLDGRPLIKEFTLAEYTSGGKAEHESEPKSIWKDYPYGDHKWGMAVDLNACTGCSACILSCQAENNVPVVGKDEVRRQREMHWIRLDRYYQGGEDDPTTAYQPVMCNQCDNASCESVCPVLATVHSSEGLNMQVYNRCVGTRYCANNCPYKVRRFNWFENRHDDPVANLALNPDVTVRTRGVMEKCTFCVQRIEEVKIKARNEGRAIRDGEIEPACQQSCPAKAITFGDLADQRSKVYRLKHDRRDYILLEDLNLRPSISYLARVRNVEEA